MVDRAAIAVRVRLVREELGLTQKELAEKAGVRERTVQTWEGGTRTPTLPSLRRLGRITGRKPVWFLHGAGGDPLNRTVKQQLARRAA